MRGRRSFIVLVGVGLAILLSWSLAWGLFGLGRHGSGMVADFAETLRGLNQDMRETLHAIREGGAADQAVELLHDELHLMREVLHLVSRDHRDEPAFQRLHGLNHEMRETWHQVKKGRERDKNLGTLHDQLHAMREALDGLRKK